MIDSQRCESQFRHTSGKILRCTLPRGHSPQVDHKNKGPKYRARWAPEAAVRVFTTLNHPEPDDDGVQRYSVHEVILVPARPGERRYVRVADDLTVAEADEWIAKNGIEDA